jgi:hypothetical protein
MQPMWSAAARGRGRRQPVISHAAAKPLEPAGDGDGAVPCRRLPCLPAQASQLAGSTYIHLHRQKQTAVSKPMGTGVSEDLVLLLLYELKSLVQVSWFTRHDSNTGIYAAHSNTSLYVSFCCK